jgi:hypothetical protein
MLFIFYSNNKQTNNKGKGKGLETFAGLLGTLCIYIYIWRRIYIYIYIYRERERERGREGGRSESTYLHLLERRCRDRERQAKETTPLLQYYYYSLFY